MYTNVNLAAPVGALTLLGTAVLLFLALIVLIHAAIVRRRRRAKFVMLFGLVIAGVYLVTMMIFSLASHETVLARGQEKHFCELDCHLAYSIVNTTQAKMFGSTQAKGQFTVITIKTRFDETTIAPWRGNGLLHPNGRALMMIDDQGNQYSPVSQAGTTITTALRPGESYATDIAFDLPANAKPTSLLINEAAWETRLVIGHENSLLHRKTRFQI